VTDKKKPDKPALRIVGDADGVKKTKAKTKSKPKRRALTAKQERFVAALIRGANQADAYREAYDCDAMGSHAIHCEASLLASHREVTARILANQASIERASLSSALTRRRWIVERLEHEAANAESDAARVRSLELLGKTQEIRLFADIVETSTSDASPDQVRAELEQRLTALLQREGWAEAHRHCSPPSLGTAPALEVQMHLDGARRRKRLAVGHPVSMVR